MNSNRRVLLFVVYSIGTLLLLSFAGIYTGVTWLPFQRVNLLSDVIKTNDSSAIAIIDTGNSLPPVPIEKKPQEDFSLYNRGRFITNFSTDTSAASLQSLMAKLHDLKTGKKRKIRIAYFGDSMIEGDLLTQTLRKLLQQEFGGAGVGFVPITSQVSKFRQTVTATYSDGWDEDNFKQGRANKLYLSGHLFHSANATVQMTDNTIATDSTVIVKSLLFGETPGPVSISVNGGGRSLRGSEPLNRQPLATDLSHTVRIGVADDQLPVYGISFESDSGIFVDNFSFRGITGIEYAKIDSSFLASIAQQNPYDLIVFQYGVNLLFRPNDKNFNWYARAMLPIVRKMRHTFSNSEFILVSTADRAFRYGGEWKSAVGIDSLIKVQALLAYETGSSFYNQYESMGGRNSIVDWAGRSPSLANKDYVHPNHRGAEILGTYFFESIMQEYNKYLRKLN